MNARMTVKLAILLGICIGIAQPLYAGKSNMEKTKRKILFGCPTSTIEEFKAFAEKAAELGATHVYISDLPKSRWQWEMDLTDPYPNWGMLHATIFKIIIPPELREFLPADDANKNMEIMSKRYTVLKGLGLKAAFSGSEPAWLPEEVYRPHPDWRGPRCEHPRRARNTYYAPCIDQPQVLKMYRESVAELCRHAPIETFDFLTNDCGGGICWSVSLYPGQNGPAWCQKRSYADRVVGFLSTIQDGAKDAGLEAEVSFQYGSGYISKTEVASVIPYLKPGQTINGRNNQGFTPTVGIGFGFYNSGVGPVIGIPQVMRIADQLQSALSQKDVNLNFNFTSLADSPELFDVIRLFKERDVHSMVERFKVLHSLAAGYVGEENAESLMQIWQHIDDAVSAMQSIGPDPLMLVGVINQRWIVCPLVPFPLELTPAEKDYVRKFQFQANSEEEAADLMNLQGFEMVNGYSGSLIATGIIQGAVANLLSAVSKVEGIRDRTTDENTIVRMDALHLRLKTLICFYQNVKNTIQYQDILDRTDYEHPPVEENIYPMDGDQLLREIQIVTRAEIDNINELISFLESSKVPLLKLAPSMEEEDIFLIGPNIVEQLRKKIAIMLRHQLDVNRLYRRRQG